MKHNLTDNITTIDNHNYTLNNTETVNSGNMTIDGNANTNNLTVNGTLAVTGSGSTITTPDYNAKDKELVNAEWVVKALISDSYLYVNTADFNSFEEMINHINTLNATMVDITWGPNVETSWGQTYGILTNQKLQRLVIRLETQGNYYKIPTIDTSGTITAETTSVIQNLVVTDDIKITCYSDVAKFSNPRYCYLPLNFIIRRNPSIPSLGNQSTSSKSPVNITLTLMYGACWTGGFWTDETMAGIGNQELINGVLKLAYIPIWTYTDCNILMPNSNRWLGTAGCKISFEENNGITGHSKINIFGGTINLYGLGYHNLNNVHFTYPTTVNVYGGAMAFIPNKTNLTTNQAFNAWTTNGIIYDGTLK